MPSSDFSTKDTFKPRWLLQICSTRELPGVALVNISTWPIFMGKGNTLFREICITLPGRVRRIERHRLSGYQSLGLCKHLDEPQTKDSHIS